MLIRRVEACIHKHNHPVANRLPLAIELLVAGLAEAGELTRATALLHKMEELHAAGQLPEAPDTRAYQTLLAGWQKSNHAARHRHIAKLESRILEMRGY